MSDDKVEKVEISPEKVKVNLDVQVSVNLFEEALKKSQTYWEVIKPRLDVGKFIESCVKEPKAFYVDFYTQEIKSLKDLIKLIKKHR